MLVHILTGSRPKPSSASLAVLQLPLTTALHFCHLPTGCPALHTSPHTPPGISACSLSAKHYSDLSSLSRATVIRPGDRWGLRQPTPTLALPGQTWRGFCCRNLVLVSIASSLGTWISRRQNVEWLAATEQRPKPSWEHKDRYGDLGAQRQAWRKQILKFHNSTPHTTCVCPGHSPFCH